MKRLTKFARELMKSPPSIWDEVMPEWARGLLAAKVVDAAGKKQRKKRADNEKDMGMGQER